MTTRLGLIADVHATAAPVAEALALFRREAVDTVICAGDIAGYFDDPAPVVDLLIAGGCRCIIGNHDQTWLNTHADLEDTRTFSFLSRLPETLRFELEHKSVSVVHAQPPRQQHGGIKLLDIESQLIAENVDYWSQQLQAYRSDVLIVGHTHQVFAEKLGGTLVVNPGSTVFNHSCAVLTLPSMQVEFYALSNKPILKTWNWGMAVRGR
jgi:putative phosphoesterase